MVSASPSSSLLSARPSLHILSRSARVFMHNKRDHVFPTTNPVLKCIQAFLFFFFFSHPFSFTESPHCMGIKFAGSRERASVSERKEKKRERHKNACMFMSVCRRHGGCWRAKRGERRSVSSRRRVGERGDVRVAERKREESGIELSPPSLAC